MNITQSVAIEEDIDIVIDEIFNHKGLKKSDIQIEICDDIQELKYPEEHEDNGVKILGDLVQKELKDSKVQEFLRKLDTKRYLYSQSVKITTSYRNELYAAMQTSFIYS